MAQADDLADFERRLRAAGEVSPSVESATDKAKLIAANQTAWSLNWITGAALFAFVMTCVGFASLAIYAIWDYDGAMKGAAIGFEAFKVIVLPILTLVIGLYTGRKSDG